MRRATTSRDPRITRELAVHKKNYDAQVKVVFDALRQLLEPPSRRRAPVRPQLVIELSPAFFREEQPGAVEFDSPPRSWDCVGEPM